MLMLQKFIAAIFMLCLTQLPAYASGEGSEFVRFLKEYETARRITVNGPFVVIDIHYRKPGSYFTSAELFYSRVIFNEKIYLKRVDRVQQWEGAEPSTFLVYQYDGDKSPLHVLSHRNGNPVMERIDIAASHWDEEAGFEFGYPVDANTRYFPRRFAKDAGFLLKAHPVTAIPLPTGLDSACCAPSINTLAGISPDGKAFAYADRPRAPSALIVVSEHGKKQAPIPIALSRLDNRSGSDDKSPFQSLWRWLPMHFKWGKDATDNWDLFAQSGAAAHVGSTTLESLFILPKRGYRTCFVPSNSSCASGWREMSGDDEQRVFGKRLEMAVYGYVPNATLKVFDAPVELLIFGAAYSGSGYQLYLQGRAENVVNAIERRFASEKVDYLRVNQCPPDSDKGFSCLSLLKEKFQWPSNTEYRLASILEESEKDGAVFITADVAFVVRQLSKDVTAVLTLGRYSFATSEFAQ